MGNTQGAIQIASFEAVHPHACGEHVKASRTARISARFIPTPVGNTLIGEKTCQLKTVHPHACGEHGNNVDRHHGKPGSSPRLWGTRSRCLFFLGPARFIPTPVGNTAERLFEAFDGAVHPHACGEHACFIAAAQTGNGSSPRLWGTRALTILAAGLLRFIPTPVGNTTGFGFW